MREINFPEKDGPLREDVRVLGALVGEMLAEQESPEFLRQVEAVRRTAIGRREDKAGANPHHQTGAGRATDHQQDAQDHGQARSATRSGHRQAVHQRAARAELCKASRESRYRRRTVPTSRGTAGG